MAKNATGAASNVRSFSLFNTSTSTSTGRKKIACSLNAKATPKNSAASHGRRVIRKYRQARIIEP